MDHRRREEGTGDDCVWCSKELTIHLGVGVTLPRKKGSFTITMKKTQWVSVYVFETSNEVTPPLREEVDTSRDRDPVLS